MSKNIVEMINALNTEHKYSIADAVHNVDISGESGGAFKAETTTEFVEYLKSLGWAMGGTYTETYDGQTYTLTVRDDAFAMKNCPWSKFPAAPTNDSYHMVVWDGVTDLNFQFDITLRGSIQTSKQLIFGKGSIGWFSFSKATGMRLISINFAGQPAVYSAWVSGTGASAGELLKIVKFDGAGLTISPGCTTATAGYGGLTYTNARGESVSLTYEDVLKIKQL